MGLLDSSLRMSPFFAVAILVLVLPFVTCIQQPPSVVAGQGQRSSSSPSQLSSGRKENANSRPKLKICSTDGTFKDLSTETIEIPTFSTTQFTYSLQEYEIDRDNRLETCSDGEKPTPYVNVIPHKVDYDEEHEANNFSKSFVFGIIRSSTFLFDNGYLSVGNDTSQTAEYFSMDEFCVSGVQGKGLDATADFRTCPFPKGRPRLHKCCPFGMILGQESCIGHQKGFKFDPGYMDAKTWKILPIDQADPVYTSPHLPCDQEEWEFWEIDNCTHEFHPVTDNTVAYIGAYRTWEFFNSSTDWCIDFMRSSEDGHEHERMVLFQCVGNETSKEVDGKNQARISLLYMINMYIGALFHLMTTLVYLITWPKQNIHGKTLCSCTASLFFMQIFLGTAHLLGRIKNQRKTSLCIVNSIGGQYFMIAAFTWLLVVNYDLWRTFRSIRTEGGKSLKRFLAYSSFGWLFPLIISAISVSLDFSFPCRVSRVPVPEFGEYYCFVSPWAQGLYVYYILGVLIALVCILAALTLFGLYTFKKDTVNLRSSKRADDQQNVLLFLKLSVVMGLTWVFEVISWAATKETENHIGWIILDLYNALSAILIFLIFVCKRTTLNLLEQAVPILKGITAALSKLSSTFSGEPSSVVNNTASTTGGNGHKKSFDSQGATVVRYTKKGELDGSSSGGSSAGGKTNKAFE